MKILVGYDGSASSDAALDDLKSAGLPDDTEAFVMSVAEVWLPPEYGTDSDKFASDSHPAKLTGKHCQKAKKTVAEFEMLARHACERLLKMFPSWNVKAEATYGSPAWKIITKATDIKADLVVVGSQGRTAIGRLFLGSVSQKILSEADYSVRIARGRIEVDPILSRIIIGFDGSKGAHAAVENVASRRWSEDGEVTLVAVSDPITPSAIGRFVPPIADWIEEADAGEREWLEKSAECSMQKLREAGLKIRLLIKAGSPKQILVEEAKAWHADTIFVGASRFGSRVERFLLGSVSAAVAARAHCTVEVVRRKL